MGLEKVTRALVVGLGISGQAAADKLLREGKQVVVNDLKTWDDLRKTAESLSGKGARVELGHHGFELLEGVDLMVVSPGIPASLPLFKEAARRGIRVWSEIELAWHFARGPVVAVTGTNGKTTTVSMIEAMMSEGGKPVRSAGNIGFPMVRAVEEAGPGEVLVVEVSSFQLAHIEDFRPAVAVLLNIAQDHFDWHDDMDDYTAAKSRIWMNQSPQELVITNLDDRLCVEAARGVSSRLAFFSKSPEPRAMTFVENGVLRSRIDGRSFLARAREIMDIDDIRLEGQHNLENAMAAASASLAMGVAADAVRKALSGFEGLDHRLQFIAEVGGISFFNDSKATNPHATMRALSAFDQPLVLILGGKNKGLDFGELAREIAARSPEALRLVYAIGEAGPEIEKVMRERSAGIETRVLPGLKDVFGEILTVARPGDVVLFSPACASFDAYEDYKQRGKHFQALVEACRREEANE